MTLLLLKLTITPAVIALATIVARRFGAAFGGWLIGLPFTNGPAALFLTLEHGPAFTAHVARGFIAGISGEVAFVLTYVALVRRGGGWLPALAAGSIAYGAVGSVLASASDSAPLLLACALAALLLGLRLVPQGAAVACPPAQWELPVRMVLATTLVVTVTAFASAVGPGLSGVATTFPLMSSLLAVCVHRANGPAAAIAVYRGLLAGLFALMGFAATLILVLSRLPLGAAFAVAVALTLSIQLGSLHVLRRGSIARTV
jgi:hypothetical protein